MTISLGKAVLLLAACIGATAAAPTAAAPTASNFTFYQMPTVLADPCDLCTGPDGALWISDMGVNKIGRLDPDTGVVDEYDIPFTEGKLKNATLPGITDRTALACAIRPGADGNIYASYGVRNQLVQVIVSTKQVNVLTPPPFFDPLGDLQPFNDMVSSPTGMYFTQTTANIVSFYEYSTKTFKNYKVPTLEGSPLGIIYASDGYAYFAEFLGNKIARLNPNTSEITEFPLPLSLAGPAVIRAETENKYIWFTAFIGNGIGRFELATGEITSYTFPSPAAFPAEDTIDSNGIIWFSTATQNTLNTLDPKTGEFATIKEPDTLVVAPVSVPFYLDIAMHYGPGNAMWFTNGLANRVGRYQL